MDLYVGNLTEDVTATDLDVLFLSFRPMRLRLGGSLNLGGKVMRYAVATVIPDRLALRAQQQLHGRSLRGRTITVREYFARNPSNERRGRQHRVRPWHGEERRCNERRAVP